MYIIKYIFNIIMAIFGVFLFLGAFEAPILIIIISSLMLTLIGSIIFASNHFDFFRKQIISIFKLSAYIFIIPIITGSIVLFV